MTSDDVGGYIPYMRRVPPSSPAPNALTRQLLEWVAARPRSYEETLTAWRTSCPRLPVWEDATDGGLVEVVNRSEGRTTARVELTPLGRAAHAGC